MSAKLVPHYAAWHSLVLSRGGFSYITFTFGLLTFTFNKVHLRDASLEVSDFAPKCAQDAVSCFASYWSQPSSDRHYVPKGPSTVETTQSHHRLQLDLSKVWTRRYIANPQIDSTGIGLPPMVLSEIDIETSCACSRRR